VVLELCFPVLAGIAVFQLDKKIAVESVVWVGNFKLRYCDFVFLCKACSVLLVGMMRVTRKCPDFVNA
jgi:hypothetical protein